MDRLSWKKVYAIIDAVFRVTDIKITVYLLPKLEAQDFPNKWDETDKTTKFYGMFNTHSSFGPEPKEGGWFPWKKQKSVAPDMGTTEDTT